MSETIDVPVAGKVNKTYVYVGGALVVGIVGYAWFKRGTEGPAPVAAEPDFGAIDYVDPSGGRPNSSGDFTEEGPDVPRTNAEWSQKALEILVGNVGYGAQLVAGALGKYLNRQGLTVAEKGAVIAARALVGDPPVGGPYPILDALPIPTPAPAPAPGPGPAPKRGRVVSSKHGRDYLTRTLAPGNWGILAAQHYGTDDVRSSLRLANLIPRPWIKGYGLPGTAQWNIPPGTWIYFPSKLRATDT